MGERSDEATASDPRSTEDLLEETERLLSEVDEPSAESTDVDRDAARRSAERTSATPGTSPTADADDLTGGSETWWRTDADADDDSTPETSSSSRLSRLTPSVPGLSPSRYFSPRSFLVLTLVLAAGFVAGGVIPVAGRILGLFAVAFLIGLVTSNRRYLEVTAAGAAVGGTAALFNEIVLVVAGVAGMVVPVGAATGVLACVLGYYFGRDLRDGLFRDVETG